MILDPFFVGSLYKLVDTVLVGRLREVLGKLVFPNQYSFLKGRMLMDDVVAIKEVIDLAMKSRKPCYFFKVDFKKAFDLVSLEFLDYMLFRFRFNDK